MPGSLPKVSFTRDSLKTKYFDPAELQDPSKPGGPNNLVEFKRHILLEVVTNYAPHTGVSRPHPRAHVMEVTMMFERPYQRYRYLPVMTGPCFNDIRRQQLIEGTSEWERLYNNTNVPDIALIPTLMPDLRTKKEFLWVDLTYPLRAIYIPIDWKGEIFTYSYFELCDADLETYKFVPPWENEESVTEKLSLPKRRRNQQKAEDFSTDHNANDCRRPPWQWPPRFKTGQRELRRHPDLGWGVHGEWTARFDIAELRGSSRKGQSNSAVALFDQDSLIIRNGGENRIEKVDDDPRHTMYPNDVINL
ncbi:hypothetical protein CNMCM8980_001030 [Aspergillus fumigatiaffinis]|nr:hypothetical protein CNMCM8980_001030 [Aspergillus fumigatiaffinis]